jgi:hypothetical protein
MDVGLDQAIASATGPLQEWQQLRRAAIRQAMGHYLSGCADLAMARTPLEALVALREVQTALLRLSAESIGGVAGLLRSPAAHGCIRQVVQRGGADFDDLHGVARGESRGPDGVSAPQQHSIN